MYKRISLQKKKDSLQNAEDMKSKHNEKPLCSRLYEDMLNLSSIR